MRRITIIATALATAALATTYIQTSTTGTAPWRPVKDSVSRAHLADSASKADSARASHIADTAKKAGTASNSLALGGIVASQYGTLSQNVIAIRASSGTGVWTSLLESQLPGCGYDSIWPS